MKGKLRNPNSILEEVPEEERLQNSLNGSTALLEEEEEEVEDNDVLFTKQMRVATRKIHNISDTLVNAKLGLAMSDDGIWAEGLLVFYEIFRFLEETMAKLSQKDDHFNRMFKVISGAERTSEFELDLQFYFGKDFLSSYEIRPSVADYLKHLQTLEQREPLRLLAYIYHLYMGLLSGGQILKRKRDFRNRMKNKATHLLVWLGLRSARNPDIVIDRDGSSSSQENLGNAVTTFGRDGRSISDIKKDIAFTMNDIAADLSKDEKNSIIDESLEVFRRNNEIVGSIQNTGLTALKNYAMLLMVVLSLGTAFYFFFTRSQ